jgi:cell division protein FtsW (lipid II flippase)
MKQKTYIITFDYWIPICFVALMLIGLFMQLNISSVKATMNAFYKQALWFIFSAGAVFVSFRFVDLEKLRKFIIPLLFLIIVLLVLVLIFGTEINGAKRSFILRLPGLSVNFQPSLLARILLILYCAHILDKKQDELPHSKPLHFLKNFPALIIVPIAFFGLILAERHFSVLMILGATIISLFFLARIRLSTILAIIAILVVFGSLVIAFGPSYRGARMDIYAKYSLFQRLFGEPGEYHGDAEYQIRESLISLSSGGVFGTTPRRGTGKHYFIPEDKTDYIFAIIGEEFGFFGSLIILGLYSFLFVRCLIIGARHQNLFLRFAAYGLGMNIFFNALLNIGVAMSAVPSTGVTLPFISYGGTSLLINSITIGLLMSISAERRRI